MSNRLKEDFANKVYDLLVSIGGANENERKDFIYHHCLYKNGCQEWRFQGKLGFGGKYRSVRNGVSYYHETSTPEIIDISKELEEKLSLLK